MIIPLFYELLNVIKNDIYVYILSHDYAQTYVQTPVYIVIIFTSFWWNSCIFFSMINRDNFIILEASVASIILLINPSVTNLPVWKTSGIISCVIFHIGLSEPLYYWLHRILHSPYFFQHYHWLHHSSTVNHPFTGET